MPIRQITIIGTGLIGGSLGLALKKHRFAGRIIGCDRAPVLERARNKGAIDDGHTDPADAVRGSQVIVLAAPVGAILDLIARLGPALPPKTLLTDTGSTKAEVLARATCRFRQANRTPLSGRTSHGRQRAVAAWNSPIPICFRARPGCSRRRRPECLQRPERRISASGSKRSARASPAWTLAEHDQLCAWISHLAADDLDRAGGRAGRGVRRRRASARSRRARPARDDAHFRQSLLHVARCRPHQQEKHCRRSAEAGTAAGAHPGKPRYAGAGDGVRAGASLEERVHHRGLTAERTSTEKSKS